MCKYNKKRKRYCIIKKTNVNIVTIASKVTKRKTNRRFKKTNNNTKKTNINIIIIANKILIVYINIIVNNAKININIAVIVNAKKSTSNAKKIYINEVLNINKSNLKNMHINIAAIANKTAIAHTNIMDNYPKISVNVGD